MVLKKSIKTIDARETDMFVRSHSSQITALIGFSETPIDRLNIGGHKCDLRPYKIDKLVFPKTIRSCLDGSTI